MNRDLDNPLQLCTQTVKIGKEKGIGKRYRVFEYLSYEMFEINMLERVMELVKSPAARWFMSDLPKVSGSL